MCQNRKKQKKAKNYKYLITGVFVCSLFLAACSVKNEKKETSSLYEQGMSVIGLMEEMVGNKAYGEMMTGSSDIAEWAEKIAAGSYEAPKAVYDITLPAMEDMLSLYGAEEVLDGISDTLKQELNDRLQTAVLTQINAQGGTAVLAASSVYTAGKTFVSQELEENKVYLYLFDEGCPVAVSFVVGEDHSVRASGSFLISLEESLSDAIKDSSEEELQEALQAVLGEGCMIQKLEQ